MKKWMIPCLSAFLLAILIVASLLALKLNRRTIVPSKFANDEKLQLDCTPYYADSVYGPPDPQFYFDNKFGNGVQALFTDEQKEQLVNLISEKGNYLSGAQFCRIEGGQILMMYEYDYFTPNQTSYFMLTNQNDESTLIGKIHEESYSWFHCTDPLELSKRGVLYYQCEGGSNNVYNPNIEKAIYRIDLNKRTVEKEVTRS